MSLRDDSIFMRLTNKNIARRCKARTAEIVVGNQYFLSTFHDKEGCLVTVLDKSVAKNGCGWPSSVKIRIEELVGVRGAYEEQYYALGKVMTVNACNLYEKQGLASVQAKYPSICNI